MISKKQTALIAIKIISSISIIYYIIGYQDIDFNKIYHHLLSIPIGWMSLILLMTLAGELLQSLITHKLLKLYHIHIPVLKSYQINLIGYFYSLFLLGTIGGTTIRWYRISKHNQHSHPLSVISAILIQRLFVILLLLTIFLSFISWYNLFQLKTHTLIIITLAIPSSHILAFLILTNTPHNHPFLQKLNQKITQPLKKILPQIIQSYITKTSSLLPIFKNYPKQFFLILSLSLAYQFINFLTFYLTISSLNIPINLPNTSILFLVSKLTEIIPNALGGLGIRELSFLAVHPSINQSGLLHKEHLIAIGFLQFCFIVTVSLIGGLLEIYHQFFSPHTKKLKTHTNIDPIQ